MFVLWFNCYTGWIEIDIKSYRLYKNIMCKRVEGFTVGLNCTKFSECRSFVLTHTQDSSFNFNVAKMQAPLLTPMFRLVKKYNTRNNNGQTGPHCMSSR